MIYADVKMKFSELCEFVKEKLGLENLRVVHAKDEILKFVSALEAAQISYKKSKQIPF